MKDKFVEVIGKRCRSKTVAAIRKYIENPRLYPQINEALGGYKTRLMFDHEHGFQLVAGQSYPCLFFWIAKTVASRM